MSQPACPGTPFVGGKVAEAKSCRMTFEEKGSVATTSSVSGWPDWWPKEELPLSVNALSYYQTEEDDVIDPKRYVSSIQRVESMPLRNIVLLTVSSFTF